MKLFHGTYEKVAPIIKIGDFAMSGNNVFDGLFASPVLYLYLPPVVTNGAIVIHTQRLKSDPGGNLLS
ncbi:TPA: hypothetical protein SI311_004683 [Escherichia coli]|nr:hypothetical protein [Escherichia coli]